MSASQAAWGRRATPAGLCCRSTVYLSGEQGQSFNKKSIFSAPLRNLKIIQVIFRQHLEPQTEGSGVPAPTSLVPWPFCSLPRQEKPPEQTVLLLQNRGFGVSKSPSQRRLAHRERAQGRAKPSAPPMALGTLWWPGTPAPGPVAAPAAPLAPHPSSPAGMEGLVVSLSKPLTRIPSHFHLQAGDQPHATVPSPQ